MSNGRKVALARELEGSYATASVLASLQLPRSTWYYRQRRPADYRQKYRHLREPLEAIARRSPEYGYRRTTVELRETYGQLVNHKVVQRLHRLWDLPLIRGTKPPKPSGVRQAITAAGDRINRLAGKDRIEPLEVAYADFTELIYANGRHKAQLIPIVDHVLRQPKGKGIKAIVVYPMNALANSQAGELTKFLCHGYPDGKGPVTFRRYTGQESDDDKNEIVADPPDILLTNYVMLELVLTRVREKQLVAAAQGLRFLVLDELHTYRGRQGADVALLVRRTREACHATALQCVGTSATLASSGTFDGRSASLTKGSL
jgi:hypothetical protein